MNGWTGTEAIKGSFLCVCRQRTEDRESGRVSGVGSHLIDLDLDVYDLPQTRSTDW